jgi:hypothetical protein
LAEDVCLVKTVSVSAPMANFITCSSPPKKGEDNGWVTDAT